MGHLLVAGALGGSFPGQSHGVVGGAPDPVPGAARAGILRHGHRQI